MKITLLDGQVKEFKQPMTVLAIAESIAVSLKKNCIGAVINNKKIVPNGAVLSKDCKLEIITERHALYKTAINYTAKVLTTFALKTVFPEGYPMMPDDDLTEHEFSAYFKSPKGIKFEDLKKIEEIANSFIGLGYDFKYFYPGDANEAEYMKQVKADGCVNVDTKVDMNSKDYIKMPTVLVRDVIFLARNALLPSTKSLFKIELTQLSGLQLEDDASGEITYRIHGIAETSETRLNQLKAELEEIKASDHKFIAKNLEIYHLDPIIGAGLPIWLPNGAILKQEIKKYLMEKEFDYDFIQIETPVIGTSQLYKISGHWDHYREDMFAPMALPKEEMVLKPMSCPHHISVYNYKQRSYKDLPLRFAEHALQHRYESSGSLTGLERVRAMELTDSHIFVRPNQVKVEFARCFNLIQEVLATFNIKIDYLSLSLRDPKNKEKYFDDDKMWNHAEAELEEVLKEMKLDYKKMPGEAAFYGPKLDIQARTAIGHEITVSTIQLDFLLPQKFELAFINALGEKERPIMIHRGLIGTYERFIAVLLEQTKGVLPLWCAPKQVEIIPVNEELNAAYADEVWKALKQAKIRAGIDNRDERLSYKIRDAQVKKIPFQLVLGKKEQEEKTVTYRKYGSEEQITVSLTEFIKILTNKIINKTYD
ncbi:threonyl-tRNA synthetase [Spiroplasma clarkii]|uniref:Threonine--tRNA ligase n=3 Tax=Spiroplasma clarkii TaxID=2139 RepID=A0A2K8KQ41_9MOLU|nr:threonyl-tRNA synthetase [Spiroplasma clarkii]